MIKLPSWFSDGMVIGKKARIWGWAPPGERVAVCFNNRRYETKADDSGRFEATVISDDYGGPYTMSVGNITVRDVYIGRVWLCGGQSNMETPFNRIRMFLDADITEDTRIRVFQPEKGYRFSEPAADITSRWQTASGPFLDEMHAVPYFFAKKLLENENTPIGLINIAVGGTSAEAWLPEEIIQQSFPGLHKKLAPLKIPGRVAQTEKDDAERASKWNENLEMNDTGLTEQWYSVDYNDGGWDERMLLDNNGLPPHGAVWYRKSVVLDDGAGPFTLSLGRITDSVRVYINGQPIITVDYQYPPCICGIPDGILRPGENIIAVRVVGNSNNPAFIPGKRYELKTANQSVDLTGPWKYKAGTVLPRLEPGTWFYDYPCAVYNAMLAPFLGYGVDGVIWYQGESNTKEPDDYGVLFASFINYIRERFGENLPFIYTQLANYADTTGISGKIWKNWAVVREHQRKTLAIPNTAMAVTIDCGEWNDIHPVDKKTVGERLGLCARRLVYKEDIQSEGPAVTGADVNGGTLTINFNHAKGLWAKDGRPMLDVVDTNGNTHRIYAEIQGEALMAKINEIQAERIRFGWLDCPVVTLYNAYGLPASPFEAEVNSAGK